MPLNMHCFYINLASATARRETLERNLRKAAPHWTVHRVEAVTPQEIVQYPGFNSAGSDRATACYLSHMKALTAALEVDGPVLIAEDDSHFGEYSAAMIENTVASLAPESWDFLLTSVTLMSVENIVSGFFAVRQARKEGQFHVADAARFEFACATTYVVQASAKQRLLDELKKTPVNGGYDFQLKDISRQGQLRALIPFPFLTSVSEHSVNSQLHSGGDHPRNTDIVLNAVRKLLYAEPAVEEIRRDLDSVGNYFHDDEIELLGRIFGMVNHPSFVGK